METTETLNEVDCGRDVANLASKQGLSEVIR